MATNGKDTSEYGVVNGANAWATIATIVGLLVTVGQAVAPALGGETTTAGIIVGAVVAVLGIVAKTLVSLGYVKSRTGIKLIDPARNLPELD